MKYSPWIILFVLSLMGYMIGMEWPNEILQYIFKPLLMPLLAGYFLSQSKLFGSADKMRVLLALAFSWAGDVLLMLEFMDPIFFMMGLSSFLLAHIFYVLLFHRIRVRENIKGNPWFMVIVVIYYASLISFLSPYLGDLKWPVRVYGIVISFMFMLAMHMLYMQNKKAGRWMMIGAMLFVISDSILAINKFYQSFAGAGVLIMVTYAGAQLMIVQGALEYLRNQKPIDRHATD